VVVADGLDISTNQVTNRGITMGKFGWAWIKLPDNVAQKIRDFSRQIPYDELTGDGRETNPHITLKYGLKTDDYSIVRDCLKGKIGGTAHLGVSSVFDNPDDYDVVKVSCAGSSLHTIHKFLNQLPHDDNYMVYRPHVTIAYVKKGFGRKYAGKFLIDSDFDFNTVWYKKPHGTKSISIRLSNYKESFNLQRHITAKNDSGK